MGVNSLLIHNMVKEDWEQVCSIYLEGIHTGHAAFQKEAPAWEKWDSGHLVKCRLVARSAASKLLKLFMGLRRFRISLIVRSFGLTKCLTQNFIHHPFNRLYRTSETVKLNANSKSVFMI
jgi:hypothetical protein